MGQQTLFERFIYWLFTPRYNCKKGKHRWGYTLSESGIVYGHDDDVPKELWHCLDCPSKKF